MIPTDIMEPGGNFGGSERGKEGFALLDVGV